MSQITRRRMLAMTTLAAGAPGLHILRVDASGPPFSEEQANADQAVAWIHSNRTLIAEAYNPPFYPSFDFTPEKAHPHRG